MCSLLQVNIAYFNLLPTTSHCCLNQKRNAGMGGTGNSPVV